MFNKVLIANRGEIACRIIRTCQRLGVRTVAVYSDADKKALHVRMADEAYRIGPAPSTASYLRIDRLIAAAKKAKVEAIHPGYGFLSENFQFAQAVIDSDMKFIGPSPEAIKNLGDKVLARQLAKDSNVPVIPGTEQAIELDAALPLAFDIGFPLLVKAADGGGGMGIRLVEKENDLIAAIERAKHQSLNAFNSDRVYLEKFLGDASHVEVQILVDNFGNALHLFERDCSVQRRHQKVIEEAPCSKISTDLRQELTDAAIRLVKNVGYTNAGTVEFLVTPKEEFFFLEMNTRIQVEHTITEMITGLDLVELQLRIAAGEELSINQDSVQSNGHAIEVRIYPEDPELNMPTTGTVSKFEEPQGTHIRVDSALYPGYEVTTYYEPLMAKVIAWGTDRTEAIASMVSSLKNYKITGVPTNIQNLIKVLNHPVFANSKYNTSFLERMLEALRAGGTGKELIAAIAAALELSRDRESLDRPGRWKLQGRRELMASRFNTRVN